ncbi:ATP-binding protein [Actinoallomurus sp. CA-150999]|uniref:ATP-binding protein n=1 Tax=Actinoallomurus sp. CA-150999 TaxID=3239887 RepID=UPI003D8C3AD1
MSPDTPYDPRRPAPGRAQGDEAAPAARAASPPILDQLFDRDSLYALRSAVEAHAVEAGMPQGRAEDIVICVHELATNAIRHGAGAGRARIWHLPGHLRCQVDDGGEPPAVRDDPSADGAEPRAVRDDLVADGAQSRAVRDDPVADGADPARLTPDDDFADRWPYRHGHGLWLIRCAADTLSLHSGPAGTHAVLTFTLPRPGPRPPFHLGSRALPADEEAGRRRLVLTVTGDLDLRAGSELLATVTDLLKDHPADLILDLRGLAFWDTAGMASVSSVQHHVDQDSAASVTIVGPEALHRRLRNAGLAEKLTFADDIDAAVRPAEDTGRDSAD